MNDPFGLIHYFDSMLDQDLMLLRRLVEFESHTLDKAAVDRLAEFLANAFRSEGAEAEIIPGIRSGNPLKAVWKSRLGAGNPVLVLGHLDTVWKSGTLRERPFEVKEGKAFGPGVFDMKAGILLSLLVCRALREKNIDPGKDVRFFFAPDEEVGSDQSLHHLNEVSQPCQAVLCLEPPLPGGKAKTFRKGGGVLRLRVRGIAAHAGVDHASGANAVLELSRQVVALSSMTDYERGITVSVGTICGGTASNVVPAEAEAAIDIRVSTKADGEWIIKRIQELPPCDSRCTLSLSGGIHRPPLERTAAVIQLYEKARSLAKELDMELGEGSTGGGSDGCFTAARGIPTLDGLGVDGDGAHALHEFIKIDDIPRRAALLCYLILSI
jgi:glutamate carboxypeptidase